jgi:hypothetical protein
MKDTIVQIKFGKKSNQDEVNALFAKYASMSRHPSTNYLYVEVAGNGINNDKIKVKLVKFNKEKVEA